MSAEIVEAPNNSRFQADKEYLVRSLSAIPGINAGAYLGINLAAERLSVSKGSFSKRELIQDLAKEFGHGTKPDEATWYRILDKLVGVGLIGVENDQSVQVRFRKLLCPTFDVRIFDAVSEEMHLAAMTPDSPKIPKGLAEALWHTSISAANFFRILFVIGDSVGGVSMRELVSELKKDNSAGAPANQATFYRRLPDLVRLGVVTVDGADLGILNTSLHIDVSLKIPPATIL